MIVVTQGHEKGIGLEVFFKALALSPKHWTPSCHLVAYKSTVQKHLKALGIDSAFTSEGIDLPTGHLQCSWLATSRLPQSTVALEKGIELAENDHSNILFTLPTTKDALRNPKKPTQRFLGHTEYLRARSKTTELGMFFSSNNLNALLITDHLPLKDVSKVLTSSLLHKKLTLSLESLKKIEPHLNHAIVAGLNPHAGEEGLLGSEEKKLLVGLKKVKVRGFKISGFYPGDTLLNQKQSNKDLLVYLHHDQGLAPFKSMMGTIGANITLGLPYIRLSVDHGTAFTLYGKNSADPRGAFFCLRKAISYQERVRGKDTNHQSARS
jgi:4-hydroxy-L-threonine phosphate dehydrogenase PdxA